LIGLAVAIGSLVSGYVAMGGHLAVIWQPWEYVIICGIAIGHADHSHGANRVRAGRQPLSGFATFRWDDEPAPPGAQQAAARVEDA